MTSSNSAPGMHGAILLISSNSRQASSTGTGTSKLFLMSMILLSKLFGRRECRYADVDGGAAAKPSQHQLRKGQELVVAIGRGNELNANGQSVRTAMGRQRYRGNAQLRPDALKAVISGKG